MLMTNIEWNMTIGEETMARDSSTLKMEKWNMTKDYSKTILTGSAPNRLEN